MPCRPCASDSLVALIGAVNGARAWRVLLAVLVALVGWLALTPRPPPEVDFGWDKLNHVLAFTALGFSACLGCAGERRACLRWSAALLAFGGADRNPATVRAGAFQRVGRSAR